MSKVEERIMALLSQHDPKINTVTDACCEILRQEFATLKTENEQLQEALDEQKVKNYELRMEQDLRRLHDEIYKLKAQVGRLEVENGLLKEQLEGKE